MNIYFKSTLTFVASILISMSSLQLAQAEELNLPGFSGTVNTTVSSGISLRVADRDCRLLPGWSYTAGSGVEATQAGEGGATAATLAGAIAARGIGAGTGDTSLLLTNSDSTGRGCGIATSDAYGNTTSTLFDIGGDNANDGNENFGPGDIFSATQKLYSEITGSTENGMGVNISFMGTLNPALDLNSPEFKQFTTAAEKEFESDFQLLNAYVTTSMDAGDSYVDLTAGRFVTSWGESTFIPVGMNGLVTNALDLDTLRSPGASIKEALLPTEQITLSTGLADGSSLEAYYQFSHDRVGLGVAGSYFGSELFGEGAKSLDASGTYGMERQSPDACPFTMTGGTEHTAAGFAPGMGMNCTSENVAAQSRHATNWTNHSTVQLAIDGLQKMTAQDLAWAQLTATAHEFTTGQDGLGGTDSDSAGNVQSSTAGTFISSGMTNTTQTTLVANAYDAVGDANFNQSATVDFYPARTGLFKDPSDGGQYGIRWGKYLDGVGTGVDIGLYYANYHSKVPYIQFKMPGNVFANDILGAYLLAAADWAGTDLSALGVTTNTAGAYDLASAAGASGDNGMQELHRALTNAAFSGGLCDAVIGGTLRAAYGYDGTNTQGFVDGMALNAAFGVALDGAYAGETVHDYEACATTASATGGTTAATTALLGTGARLFAAVSPMGFIEYQGIFPEDNTILGASFNTNIGSTTLQGEVAYRPDFPLATGAGDQIQQLNDNNGANDALAMVAIAGVDATAAASVAGQITVVNAALAALGANAPTCADGDVCGDYYEMITDHRRSTLGAVWDANGNATTDLTADYYYSKPYVEYDTWSGTVGTTTSFQASHPITVGLGADSSVFLTELGFVYVDGMNDDINGYVSRSGFNEGAPAGTGKCLGTFGSIQSTMANINAAIAPSYTTLATAGSALTNVGSGVVDALFGNGGYCEDNPGADDFAMTYRLLGSATYNNFNNTAWALSPSVVVSHDFHGYAPSSLGGFAEDSMTLSLGTSLTKGGVSVSGSYINYMDLGNNYSNLSADKDYISMSVSYAF